MYTIAELVRVARKVFGCSGALVSAALKETGRDKFDVDEAKNIVAEFAQRPVPRD